MDSLFKVVSGGLSHVDFLSSFGRTSFIDAYKVTLPLNELEKYSEAAFAPSRISQEIEKKEAVYFLCRDRGSCFCGYCKLLSSPPPECVEKDAGIELQRLYVRKEYLGKGVGKLLHMHAEGYALKTGFSRIWLRVWEGNELAKKIYLKWDYLVKGSELYRVGSEERKVLVMEKRLKI